MMEAEDIYYVEISGNKVKSYVNLNPKDIVVKLKEDKQIIGTSISEILNSIFELKRKSEMSFIKQEIVVDNDNDDEYLLLKHYFLGDEDENIDIEDDIDIDDLF